MTETTVFSMFVRHDCVERLKAALELIKQDKSVSMRYRLLHSVTYEQFEPNRQGEYWFRITVSRPFLIFKIGEKYEALKGRY